MQPIFVKHLQYVQIQTSTKKMAKNSEQIFCVHKQLLILMQNQQKGLFDNFHSQPQDQKKKLLEWLYDFRGSQYQKYKKTKISKDNGYKVFI
ncbi:hypothetical protein pb186bvf_015144 [Paramecium bursaria]